MADKDVKLIIRAKNEASRAIDAVSDALDELTKNQEKVAGSASKTDGLLGSLGDEFQRLTREASGLGALNKVAAQIDRVKAAIGRIKGEADAAAQDLAKFSADAEKAAAATKKLQGQVGGIEAALKKQEKATASARDERTKANRELRKAETAYARLQSQIAKGKKPKRSVDDAAAEVNSARKAADAAAKAYDQQREAQRGVKKSLKDLNGEISRSESDQQRLGKEVQDTSAAFDRSNAALAKSKESLAEIQTTGKGAAASLGKVAVSQNEVAEASARVSEDLSRVSAQYAAMQRFSDGAGGFTDPQSAEAIRKQRAEVDKARVAYELLDKAHHDLAASTKATISPTRQQTQAVRESAAAARAAKVEYDAQAAALRKIPGAMGSMQGIFGPFYGQSRKAMSFLQRMRGEVLSLTTAYVGLYSVISNIGGVITAYQSLEAAQNRLGAVFNQDQDATAKELGFLERQAARLGISFQTLSDQYSKFAVAAKAANYEGEATRKVFLSVAEAGRVNKLSMEQMSGVFMALEQMISKGKITSEELRRQLGDRLPGAFNIMADALDLTTAELDAMMKKGELFSSQTNLLKFAEELDKRFGGQLAESLRSTTTLIGKFKNEIYQARLRVGRGGFIEGLNVALESLNEWFDSRAGRDFFLSLGSALGTFVEILALVPQHFTFIMNVIKLLIALKLGTWLASLADRFVAVTARARAMASSFAVVRGETVTFERQQKRLAAQLRLTQARMNGFWGGVKKTRHSLRQASVSTIAFNTSLVALRGSLVGIASVARAAWAAVGGPIGFVVAGLSYLASELLLGWIGGVEEATTALDEHQRQMKIVIAAYEEAKDKTADWAKAIDGVTVDQAVANFRKLQDELDKLRGKTDSDRFQGWKFWEDGAHDAVRALNALEDRFSAGEISATEFRLALEDIYSDTASDSAREYIEQQLKIARNAETLQRELNKQAVIVKAMGGEADGVNEILAKTGETLESVAAASDASEQPLLDAAAAAEKLADALNSIKSGIPELAAEIKKLEALKELDAQIDALGMGPLTPEVQQLYDRRREVILSTHDAAVFKEIAGNTKVTQGMFSYIHKKESFRSEAYDDGYGNWTIGYGSTRVGGRAVQPGDTISQRDAMSQAVSDMNKIVAQVEAMVKVPLADSQLNALVSYAYNAGIGSLKRDGIVQPLNRGDYGGAQAAIRDGVDTSGGVFSPGLRSRREDEARLFGQGNQSPEVLAFKVKQQQQITEERRKQNESTAQDIADTEFQIHQNEMIEAGKGRQAAIEEAIRQAKEKNKNLNAEQIAQITEKTGRLYDQEHAQDGVNRAEAEVNRLMQFRQELMQQIEYFQNQGNFAQADALKGQLEGINGQLQLAIDRAIAMWRAIGGPEADLAIARLNTAKLGVANLGKQGEITGEQINKMLSSGLTDALDQFAQAVANGENAWEAARRAFLKFASDFLIQIARMIIQKAIFNLLGGASGGIGGWIAGAINHDGGIAGDTSNPSRSISPAWFANAPRYHEGGIAGLKPGEIPSILEAGEEILPENDPRHIANLVKGGGSSERPVVKVVNAFDTAQVISEGLSSPVGEEVFVNVVKRNAGTIRAALGV